MAKSPDKEDTMVDWKRYVPGTLLGGLAYGAPQFSLACLAQVDYFNTVVLQNSSENIDGRVMAVEKGRGCDDTYVVSGLVYFDSVTHLSSFIKNCPYKDCYL